MIETRINGIPCLIRVDEYTPYQPSYTEGPPDRWRPAEGGVARWVVCDRRGRPAPWLARKLTKSDAARIDDLVWQKMEGWA